MNIVDPERARLQAIVDVDRRVLEDLHHADFVLCTPSGDLWERQTYLGGLYDGSIDYTRFEPQSEIQVEESESVAVVRYLSMIDISTTDGGGHLECWHLDTFVRDEEGTWRCKWSQATDTIQD